MNEVSQFKTEADHLVNAAREDAGMGRVLDFKKGEYSLEGEKVELGTQFVAYPIEWIKIMLKFGKHGGVEQRHVYRMSRGDKVPSRESFGDDDQTQWPLGLDGHPTDPWVLQYLMPMENRITGEVVVFRSHTFGGKRAVADLVLTYGNRKKRDNPGNPVIALQKAIMPSKRFGKLERPDFVIVSWDLGGEGVALDSSTLPPTEPMGEEMRDEIPF